MSKAIRLKSDPTRPRIEWTHTVQVKSGMISQVATAAAIDDMHQAMRLVAKYYPKWHGPVLFDYIRTPGKMAKSGEKAIPGSFTYRLRWRGMSASAMRLQRVDKRFHKTPTG